MIKPICDKPHTTQLPNSSLPYTTIPMPGHIASMAPGRSSLHWLQINHQTWLLPQREELLAAHPVPTRVAQAEIEGEEDLGENEAHFGVCQTA
mgnify:CR=1 FL=1|tara:strand:- start:30044 stop:30322 length:279 start_codon:yes stop_codon:yes gene_type:complete